MAFTDQQRQALKAKLRYRHVKTRASNGNPISYVEGWHVIAEANRIFGYDSWDRQTLSPRCLWRETQRSETVCFYSSKVRITVRAGEAIIVREGIGTGVGRSAAAETAHEIALKAAETDATKRALATFGNPFGLALYDKERRGVTKPPAHIAETSEILPPVSQAQNPLLLRHDDGRTEPFDSVGAFVTATVRAVHALKSSESVYAFWEANLDSFSALPRGANGEDPVHAIGSALKSQVRALAHVRKCNTAVSDRSQAGSPDAPAQLLIPKEKRIRNKGHLTFVASQPCLVCGRNPAQAHHIRFAQPSALGLKVSDEFTVPLCNGHHDSLHHTGDERAWWARHGIIEPLKFAARLWAASRQRSTGNELEALSSLDDRETTSPPALARPDPVVP
jgi:DNA recombination protein Rad52